jgi:hypothetical protein
MGDVFFRRAAMYSALIQLSIEIYVDTKFEQILNYIKTWGGSV